MKRLLIAYDGSPAADLAIAQLAHAGLPAALEVVVISVADVYVPPDSGAPASGTPFAPPVLQRAREKALQAVNAHRALAERACAQVKTMFPGWTCTPFATGDSPAWAVISKAEEFGSDLIVLGAQSHSQLERMFLGSVSHRVAAEAPCSVRIAREHKAAGARRMLVAVDGSIDSKAALREVASRTWAPGTQVRLVTAIDPQLETAMAWPGFAAENFAQGNDESGREWIGRMTEAAAQIPREAGLDVSIDVYEGHPKEILLRASEDWPADCIFLGARGLHHGPRFSLGTVASAVAGRARCSVEIVRRAPG